MIPRQIIPNICWLHHSFLGQGTAETCMHRYAGTRYGVTGQICKFVIEIVFWISTHVSREAASVASSS